MRGLPQGSNLHTALRPRTAGWTHHDELLALIAQLIDHNNRLFIMANTKKGTRIPKPIKIDRPKEDGDAPERTEPRPQATSADIQRFFGRGVQYSHPVPVPSGGDDV